MNLIALDFGKRNYTSRKLFLNWTVIAMTFGDMIAWYLTGRSVVGKDQ